ncbi:hypothetical protein CsSME_00009190 [Camellia sinensis var. sinensis]
MDFREKIGGNLPDVHYIRDVADADSLILSLKKAQKVVVVGGGYIGMEIAAAPVGWKLDTTQNGVKFLKGVSIKNLEAGFDGSVAAVKLENGTTIEADMIVIGIGAKLAVSPFEKLPLNTTVGGIQVDGQFRTSVPSFFAIADITMYDSIARVERVDHAPRSAQHCVKAFLSSQTDMYDYLPHFYSRVFEYEGSPRKVWWQFFGDNGNFDPRTATLWIDSSNFDIFPRLCSSHEISRKYKVASLIHTNT